jgi:hypothetical protein
MQSADAADRLSGRGTRGLLDRDPEQEIIRRAYQRQIMAAFGLSDRRIEAAFASVKREDFSVAAPASRALGHAVPEPKSRVPLRRRRGRHHPRAQSQ